MALVKAQQFTREVVTWQPWLPTAEQAGPLTAEQAELMAKVTVNRHYFATLAHDPPALRERTALMNAIMYAHGGASRADRELASVATSRTNGCIYCASGHSRLHAQLTKDPTVIDRLLAEGTAATQPAREQAIIHYAEKLARDPAGLTPADLQPLRAAGLSDTEILDINNAAAVFAWANRLMQSLGTGYVEERAPEAPPAPATA
jgi:uncharacterized peroxidase-related enzyme